MGYELGLKCKLYRGESGTTAATEVKNVTDVKLNIETEEADVTTRKAAGWKLSMATLKSATIEFTMVYDTDDADFDAFQAAFLAGTPLALLVADSTGSGLDCDAYITVFNLDQTLTEAVKVNVTAKPSIVGAQGRAPAWHEGTGGGGQ